MTAAILSEASYCLDLASGQVRCEAVCPGDKVGGDRRAVATGKRFIRIPLLEQLVINEERLLAGALELCLLRRAPEGVRGVCANGGRARMRSALHSFAHELSCERIAQRWIAGLRPPSEIEWIDGEGFRTKVYAPETHAWLDGDHAEFAP